MIAAVFGNVDDSDPFQATERPVLGQAQCRPQKWHRRHHRTPDSKQPQRLSSG